MDFTGLALLNIVMGGSFINNQNEAGAKETESHDLTQSQKYILFFMTFLWILSLIFRIIQTSQKQIPVNGTSGVETQVLQKMLYFNFDNRFGRELPASVKSMLNNQVISFYKAEAEKSVMSSEQLLQLYILDFFKKSGNDEIPQLSDELRELMLEDPKVSLIISAVFTSKEVSVQTEGKEGYEEVKAAVESKLTGWFRDYSLMRLYKGAQDHQSLSQLTQKTEQILLRLIIGSVVLLIMTICGFAGLFLLIIFPVVSAKKPEYSLKNRGIEDPGNKTYVSVTFLKAWFVFLCWEFTRIAGSVVLGFYMGITKSISIALLFVVYTAGYGFTLWIIFKLFKLGSFSPLHSTWESIGIFSQNFKNRLKEVLLGLGAYCAAIPLVIGVLLIILKLFGVVSKSQNPALDILGVVKSPGDLILLFLMIGIIGPIFEEVLFRGVLYTSIRKKLPVAASILLVSFLFAFIHFDFGVLINLCLIGAVFTILYERTGSIVPSIVTHIIWNSMTFLLFITMMA